MTAKKSRSVRPALIADIDQAAQILRAGGLVAFPTETVYGLGADAENREAVERIFAVKGRPITHPLIVHLGSASDLPMWAAEVPLAAKVLAERFWPGPLTLVLRRSHRVPLTVTGGLETVALRVPAHPMALALLHAFGGALAAPSANRFGSVSPTVAAHVREDLGSNVDLILDGGLCSVGIESTIVDATNAELRILRPGGVARADLEHALGTTLEAGTTTALVRVPGSLPSHYAPRARVVVVDRLTLADEAQRHASRGRQVGVLLPDDVHPFSIAGVTVLHAPRSTKDYARTLYALLREFDRCGCELVLASPPPEAGLGAAIADRLRRAAGPREHTSDFRPSSATSATSGASNDGV